MSLRAAATEAGSAELADSSDSPPADEPEVGGVPEKIYNIFKECFKIVLR